MTEIVTRRLRLRAPISGDAKLFAAYRVLNRESHAWTEPLRAESYYTERYWKQALTRSEHLRESDEEYRFAGFLNEEHGPLACVVNLYSVARGPVQCALLGYSVDCGLTGQGYATEAVGAVVRHAFASLDLMRIEAGVLPENLASIRVLLKTGFARVGTTHKSLCVLGEWRDHDLYDQTNPTWRGLYP